MIPRVIHSHYSGHKRQSVVQEQWPEIARMIDVVQAGWQTSLFRPNI